MALPIRYLCGVAIKPYFRESMLSERSLDFQAVRFGSGEPHIPALAVNVGGLLGMTDHTDLLRQFMLPQKVHDGTQRNGGGIGNRVAINPG